MQKQLELPHSADVLERQSVDGGFSAGWGFHFQPSEDYWVDCHCHLNGEVAAPAPLYRTLDDWFAALDAYRLGRVIGIVKDERAFETCRDIAARDVRFAWMFWMPYDRPDAVVMRRALDCGAAGLKLHNAPLMRGQAAPDIWLQPDWARVFEVLEQAGRVILWHVTQRVGTSPYHGGGANSYWQEAKDGVTTTNEQLLQMTVQIAERHRGLTVVGAHQLHVGLERLAALFEQHANIVIDTSCGFFTRWGDELYDTDHDILRKFFLQYTQRILFGTDSSPAPGGPDEYAVEAFLGHVRFIRQLRLPDDVLQAVAHGNAERIFGLPALEPARRGNLRP